MGSLIGRGLGEAKRGSDRGEFERKGAGRG